MSAKSVTHMATALRWSGVIGIIAIAVTRTVIVFAPELHFDVDPAFDPHRMGGLGPAGSLLLDVLLLLSCAAALIGEWLARRGIEWKLIALTLLPLPILIWHAQADFFHLWRGMTWQAAIIAAVTIAHLSRDRSMRMTIAALLIAAAAPIIVRGVSQVTIEHAQTIAVFEEHREAFLRDRGWEPGSPNALIYERRLRQPQPLGWFSTTNIFASALLPLLALGAALALALRRTALPSGWMGFMVIIALLALVGIWLSGSKGALLIALLTIALAVLPFIPMRNPLRNPFRGADRESSAPPAQPLYIRLGPMILLALPFLALAGVLLRGWLPEGFLGDRSLLFRWHYLISSARIFAESPLLGVGPDGYQEAYTQHRLPRNPEEVVSSHSMFIDWLCMFGVVGIAWCALVFTMLLRAAGRLFDQPEYIDGLDMESILRQAARAIAIIVPLAFLPSIMAELHVTDVYGLTVRLIGAVAYAAIALTLVRAVLHADRPLVDWPLAIAAGGIVMHGQIEMSFFQPGFVVWGACLIGMAGGAAVRAVPNRQASTLFWPAVVLMAAAWTTVSGVVPAIRQELLVREAAAILYPPAETMAERIEQRRRASERLLDAYAALPRNHLPLSHAAGQWQRAATVPDMPEEQRVTLLLEAMELADRLVEAHRSGGTIARRSSVAMLIALLADHDEELREQALETALRDSRELTERDPHGISSWRRLGDVLWLMDWRDEAAVAYRRALDADARFELDPLKQLAQRERERLSERVEQAERASEGQVGAD